MERRPYTLEEARDICDDFEDLEGTEYGLVPDVFIEHVAVCPFDEDEQKVFADNYPASINTEDLLTDDGEAQYDVMVLCADPADNSSFIYTDIRSYTEARGISYKKF